MLVEEMLGVEAYEGVKQAAVCLVRRRFDIEHDDTEVLGKLVRADRELADRAESATSAALERPEQIGIDACVRNLDLTVRRDDFGFQ